LGISVSPLRRGPLLRAATQICLGVVPLLSVVLLVVLYRGAHTFAFDFHNWYWLAGSRVVHGQSMYVQPYPGAFYYPPIAALLFVPFALMPHGTADISFTVIVFVAALAALRLLNVRDWRIYGLTLLWAPVVDGWHMANVTPLLVLGVAAAWRYRDRALLAGVIVALLVSVKLFLWPLGLWFLATRRYVALGWAVACAATFSIVAFAAVGFAEFPRYASALHDFLAHAEKRGYSIITLALHVGAGRAFAYAVGLAAAGVAAGAVVVFGRRRREEQALAACIAASLLASPVVEAHYFALLLVPLALSRPRLSAVWALPLILWITPADSPVVWEEVLFLGVGAAVLAASFIAPDGKSSAEKAVAAPRSASARLGPESYPSHQPI
jgi:hypothetical protein